MTVIDLFRAHLSDDPIVRIYQLRTELRELVRDQPRARHDEWLRQTYRLLIDEINRQLACHDARTVRCQP